MSDYLKQFPGASDIKRQLEIAAEGLVNQYEENHYQDWNWFEDTLSYDNAVLPHALFVAGMTLDNQKYIGIAENTCQFLLENTFNGDLPAVPSSDSPNTTSRYSGQAGHFSFIGCNGWYEHGKMKAQFDQQPIEAASTVMMLEAAYEATQKSQFLSLQRKAFDWFLGENDLHIPIYDFRSKGCCDALTSGGVNINQGAESMLSFLLSLLIIVESYTIVDKIKVSETASLQQTNPVPLKITSVASLAEKTTNPLTPFSLGKALIQNDGTIEQAKP